MTKFKKKTRDYGIITSPEERAVYRAWMHARNHCTNPNNHQYYLYGERGIKMCDLWLNDYLAFRKHIGLKPDPTYVLDRINNSGNYEPGNIRWTTPLESIRNRRPRRRPRKPNKI